ncbi:MAG: hypothetical protein LBF04_07420 [Prevotellaceae bacterium]|jgi:hypothetical protein|nr:hypothetical protein [Prevotellaceae bacterium]
MIIILVIIGITLIVLSVSLVENGYYFGCLLSIVAAVIFVITGIYYVKHDEILIGIFQFAAAVGALTGAVYGKFYIDDYYD